MALLLLIMIPFAVVLFSCGGASEQQDDTATTNVSPQENATEDPEGTVTKQPEITPEMLTAFLRFRSAMLQKDRVVLAAMCVPGMENGCVYDETNMDSVNYKLPDLLDVSQLQVLKKRTTIASKTDVRTEGCVYKDFFSVDEDRNGFSWLVGCIELIDEEIGEYSTVFHFTKINGKFRLDAVECVG